MTERYEQLTRTLVEKFSADPEQINPGATLAELGLDSLAVAELFMNLQDEWNVPLQDDIDSMELTLDQVLELGQPAG